MRSELIGIRLPLHNAAVIRRRAADVGLTKSAFAANLVLHGLNNDSADRLPGLLDQLDDKLQRLEKTLNESRTGSKQTSNDVVQLQQQAFMIETLLILRYLVKNDLKLGGEIGRKLQKTVGDIRVAGL
jgi:Mg2+ and Co2+ transporter CorA